jgi:hypothetical protein
MALNLIKPALFIGFFSILRIFFGIAPTLQGPDFCSIPSLVLVNIGKLPCFFLLYLIPASVIYVFIGISSLTRRKNFTQLKFGIMLVFLLAWIMSLEFVTFNLRMHFLGRINATASPLISAIEKYHAMNGVYPQSLDDLVPEFIANCPRTKILGCPDFVYKPLSASANNATQFELIVYCPNGGFNFDYINYTSNSDALNNIECTKISRLGLWTYVSE